MSKSKLNFFLNLNFYYFSLRWKKRYREIYNIDKASSYNTNYLICLINKYKEL